MVWLEGNVSCSVYVFAIIRFCCLLMFCYVQTISFQCLADPFIWKLDFLELR